MENLINIIGGAVTSAAIYLIYLAHKEKRDAEKRRTNRADRAYAPLAVSEDDRMVSKTFTVRDALNGKYIEFRKHQYNPSGPNFNEHCVYIVKDDESLIDAIAVVLVLMDKGE